ncbi:DMT family transporter [Fusobacteria bacterium ZRK30]|nr:DMT family transporter [Fusobacteria bacterium ZRK30]
MTKTLTLTKEGNVKYLLLIIIAICFLATGGIFVKLSTVPPVMTGFYRVLFSLPILFPVVKKNLSKIDKKDFILILLAGVFLACDLILWNISFHLTTVANSNLLANLVPFTIVPISYFIFKEKIPKLFFLGLGIVLMGVILLMYGKINPNTENYKGDLLAFLTSIFYALFLLTVYKVRKRVKSLDIMFISGLSSCLVLLIAGLTMEKIKIPLTFTDFYPLIGLAFVSQIGGQGLLSYCLGKVSVTLSSVLILSQPVIGAIYSFIIFNERLSSLEILGVFITLIGIFISKKGYN